MHIAGSFEEAVDAASKATCLEQDTAFVIGGGEVYRLALPSALRIYLTRVHATVEGDATFPPLDPTEWRLVSSEEHPADDRNEYACTFEVWERAQPA